MEGNRGESKNGSRTDCLKVVCRNDEIDEALQKIDDLLEEIKAGRCEPVLAVGGDIGRTRNASEFFAVGLSNLAQYPLRLMITMDNCSFQSQEAVLKRLFSVLPVMGAEIDRNGLGMELAENIQSEFPFKVRGVNFTNETKKLWATDMKMLFQKLQVPIPVDRDLAYQIHSIKKIVTASRNLVFDTERNEKHHADKFWALALAISAARREWLSESDDLFGSFVLN